MNCRMATWKQVGENLVRHQSGTIYLRAKVAGKIIRRSLDTDDLAEAKRRRGPEVKLARKHAASASLAAKTIEGALAKIEKTQTSDPHLKVSTHTFYKDAHKALRKTLPLNRALREWKEADARAWWTATAKTYSTQRANHLLSIVKQLGTYIHDEGIGENPTLKLRRVRIIARIPFSPTKEQIDAILESILSQKKANSVQAAALAGFLAFSGCRIAEARSLRWEDIKEDWSWLTITGGKLGTKNGKVRHIPVNVPLLAILKGLHHQGAAGQIFHISRPREAFQGALTRLKLPHLRIHDLRHFFASWCLESGIDIATVAKWLGHKDGGVLLMKTYGHIGDQHSLDSAGKLG